MKLSRLLSSLATFRAINRNSWLLSSLLMLPASSLALDYAYTSNNGSITITGYTGPGGAVAIPDTIDGLPVAVIGTLAFNGKTSLTSVTIPDSVTTIEMGAFADCRSLLSATIPNSVTVLGSQAFYRCFSLSNVYIPSGIIDIGDYAFFYCETLTNIAVADANPSYSSLNGALFDKMQTKIIQFPEGMSNSFSLPDSVTTIGLSAFDSCYGLTNVILGTNVTTISDFAFFSCHSLPSVMIGNKVTSIGKFAFASCSAMTNITFGDGITSIGSNALFRCGSLTSVYLAGNAPDFEEPLGLSGATKATVYYVPGTTGWESTFSGRPTAIWLPSMGSGDNNFGVSDGLFGFNISWAGDRTVVVEAAPNLISSDWTPVSTNTLTDGSSSFSDPGWNSRPARFYRLRSP